MCNMFPSTFTQGFFSHFAETIFFHLEFRTKMNVNELNDKWTLQEWWTQGEHNMNSLCTHSELMVNALWTVSANRAERRSQMTARWPYCERTVSARWTHCERTVTARWTLCKRTVSAQWAVNANGTERSDEHKWTHGERTVSTLSVHGERTVSVRWTHEKWKK